MIFLSTTQRPKTFYGASSSRPARSRRVVPNQCGRVLLLLLLWGSFLNGEHFFTRALNANTLVFGETFCGGKNPKSIRRNDAIKNAPFHRRHTNVADAASRREGWEEGVFFFFFFFEAIRGGGSKNVAENDEDEDDDDDDASE